MNEVSRAPASIGVIGTTVAHGLFVGALLFAGHRRSEPATISYAVTLTAAPAPSAGAPSKSVVAPPQPTPEKVVAAKPTVKAKKPPAKKPPAKQPEVTKPVTPPNAKPAPKEAPKATTTPLPGETPSTGQDVLTRTFPGLDFPDREYLAKIVNEVYSRFADKDWPDGLEATVGFTIHRDGSITDIVMLKSSRWLPFNLAAKSAVTEMAKAKVLPPLPAMWPSDALPISFSFAPRKP